MNDNEALLDNGYTAVYYHPSSNSSYYIAIEDNSDLIFLTITEALALLKWLQEQRSNIEALQQQESTK